MNILSSYFSLLFEIISFKVTFICGSHLIKTLGFSTHLKANISQKIACLKPILNCFALEFSKQTLNSKKLWTRLFLLIRKCCCGWQVRNSFKPYKLRNSIVLAHQKMLLWLARAERHFMFFMRASLLTDEYLVGIESWV